jgi:hypothetical protein
MGWSSGLSWWPFFILFEGIIVTFASFCYNEYMDILNHKNLLFIKPQIKFENLPAWFQRAQTENAVVTMTVTAAQGFHWLGGIWYKGIWNNGSWYGGTWHSGIWNNGIWYDGTWLDGVWHSGQWHNGIWHNGKHCSGHWNNGTWLDGEWKDGNWKHGVFVKGTSGNKPFYGFDSYKNKIFDECCL